MLQNTFSVVVVIVVVLFTDTVALLNLNRSCGRISHTPQKLSSHTKNDDAYGFYIHIPYCKRRCNYCDFAIIPVGLGLGSEKSHTGFIEIDHNYRRAITTEIDELIKSLDNKENQCSHKKIPLSSIYFGGGTPSLAPIETIVACLDSIKKKFFLTKDAEITIEMDPSTFDEDHLLALKEIGINRISLGVQSFTDEILEGSGRVHRRKDVFEAIRIIESVFGSDANYSIDLISGLPGLNLQLWNITLLEALSLNPPPNHVSIYDLQIEEGTAFGKWYGLSDEDEREKRPNIGAQKYEFKEGLLPLPSPDECAEMYRSASEIMRCNGFEHYEISSYARIESLEVNGEQENKNKVWRSQHNQIYWKVDSQWYAVGLGSTSKLKGKVFARERTLSDYITWVKRLSNTESLDWFPIEADSLDVEDKDEYILDTIMTRLRTKDGLDMNWAFNTGGHELLNSISRGAKLGLDLGLAEIVMSNTEKDEIDKGILRLKDPDGFLFSNNIISEIFAEL